MKRCSKCTEEKDESEFAIKRKGKLQSHCKPCGREMTRNHYHNNKEYYFSRNKKRKLKAREFILSFLKENPCVVCGEADIVVLEFDHLDPKLKSANIAVLINSAYGLPSIKKEIAKCQVLCANCHKRKTAKDYGWHKALFSEVV